jgi:hypothetical protein
MEVRDIIPPKPTREESPIEPRDHRLMLPPLVFDELLSAAAVAVESSELRASARG